MTDLYPKYITEGFKAIRCRGYNHKYNSGEEYKRAKQAIDEGFTKNNFTGLTLSEISDWEKTGGWVGWVIPENVIGIDIEDVKAIAYIENLLNQINIEPSIHSTNKGKHYLFKLIKENLSGASTVYTKAGVRVTYRVGNKNYLILAPTNERTWEKWKPVKELPGLPKDLFPYERKNKNELLRVLSWKIGECLRNQTLHGYDDIDTAFMGFLIDCELSEEEIHNAFQLVFLNTYDWKRTQTMYERAKQKLISGDNIRGAGTFFHNLREYGLKDIESLARDLKSDKKESPLKVVNIGDFLSLEIPPRENILKPFLASQSLTMIHGFRGVGKTHVGISIAIAVSAGGHCFKWLSEKPYNVLYIDGEMPAPVVQERFSKQIISVEYQVTPDNLRIITPDLQEYGMPDLSTLAGQKMIEPYLADIKLVIIDNLSTLCRSGKENEGESWLPVQEWGLKLRTKGISVLFIHHSGKNGLQRGTSRREDVLDTVINLRRPADYQANEGARFELHFEKARGLYGDDAKPFEAMLMEKDGKLLWMCKDLDQSLTEKVAELLNQGLLQNEIAEELKISKGTVSKHKNKAVSQGLIKR